MNELDSLLDADTLAYDARLPDTTTQEEAAAWIAAQLLEADTPVSWLNQLADALASRAAQAPTWAAELPANDPALPGRIDEAACAWEKAVECALSGQAQAYADLLMLGSQPDTYPRQLLADAVAAHRARLVARFGEQAPGAGILARYRTYLAQRQASWQALNTLLAQPLSAAYLRTNRAAIALHVRQGLLAEASLQHEEGQLPEQALSLLQQPDTAQWVGVTWQGTPLPHAWVVTLAATWPENPGASPLLLWVHGEGGGMFYTHDLQALKEKITFTLSAPLHSALADETIHAGDPTALGLVALGEDPVLAEVEQWATRFQALEERLLTGANSDALEQATGAARSALALPVDATRHLALGALEQQWQADAVLEHLPVWLLARPVEDRQALAERLRLYHQAASVFEWWLNEQLPDFPTFAGQLLAQRIKQDLGTALRPDTPLWRRPKSVTFEWFGHSTFLEPSPEGTFPSAPHPTDTAPALQWVPSAAWETVTLQQLASENLDAEDAAEVERLRLGNSLVPGVSAAWLLRVLPALDPLKHYEERLRLLLDPEQSAEPEHLRRPFELELQVLAQMARWQHRLSEEGLQRIRTAAPLHSARALHEQGLALHWLVVNAGEELGRTVEGGCILVAGDNGPAILLLPGAPDGYELLERTTLAEVREALLDAIRLRPAMTQYVAQRLGDDPTRFVAYFRQAAARRYEGYLTTPRTLDQTLVGLQLNDRRAWLRSRAVAVGRSQRDIMVARNLAAHNRYLGYLKAGFAVLPGVGTLISLEDIYDSSRAVAAAWHQEDPEALGLAALGVATGVLDVLLSAVPGALALVGLRRAVQAQARARTSLQASRAALAGYEAPLRARSGIPLAGRDAGTWRIQGEQYIWQDGRAYAVYRRPDEQTFRLRATATRRYEAPVRRDGERWVLHAQAGLRGGGGKLNEAEQLFATWGPGSRHAPFTHANRQQALQHGRRLLAQYHFPDMRQASEFANAYIVEGAPPAWALRYRTGAGSAQPVLPSPSGWQQVRWQLRDADRITPSALGGEVHVQFGASEQRHRSLRWEGHYYPLLPGMGPEAFIAPVGREPHHLRDLDALIRGGTGPIRVRLGENRSVAPALLGHYIQTFDDRLAHRFPSLSPHSRQALGEAWYRQADPDTGALTQRRLATLDARLQAPLAHPLQGLQSRAINHLHLELQPQQPLDAFSQVRWRLGAAADSTLRMALGYDDVRAFQGALGRIIAQFGYHVLFDHATAGRYMSIFRRNGLPQIYVLVQRDRLGVLSLQGNNGITQLSPAWLDMLISRVANPELAAMLRQARPRGYLHTLFGGMALEGTRPIELVWEHIVPAAGINGGLRVRNWRHATRPLQPTDVETIAGSGLYRIGEDPLAQAARVQGRWLPLYPAEESSRVLLSRTPGLPSPLTFETLEQCIRERFGEQPWLVIREAGEWTVRRQLFWAPLDRLVGRVRPGLTRQSALNVAHAVFEGVAGSDHTRLLHLEHVLSSWLRDSQGLAGLADPLLLLAARRPQNVATGWGLDLPTDTPGSAPQALYLRPVEQHTQGLVAALASPRMRHHAPNVIDDMLTRYGLTLDHRTGAVIQYRQPATGRTYLVALQVSESDALAMPLQEGLQVLSDTWIARWQQQLPAPYREALQRAVGENRLVRLTATLRLGGLLNGHVVVQRLADF